MPYKKILFLFFTSVVANAKEVISVNLREEDMKYGSTGYVVVLNFLSGYSMGVTEVATSDDRRYFLSFIFVNNKNLFAQK